MPQKWINTIPLGSEHTLGTLNHGLEPLFCCFITHFGVGSSLVAPSTPWCPLTPPWTPLEPPWPLVCHPLPYSIILGHYGSYLSHSEWVIEAITTLQQCCVSCVSCVSCVTVVCYGFSSNVLYVFHPMDQYYVPHSEKTSIIEVITDMK